MYEKTTHVILVNESDTPQGIAGKLEAHRQALLHRAFSVLIFNSRGEMLLQQRAAGKYHSPLLWTNACCSHPLPGEETGHAATRRLREEMGMELSLRYLFSFRYRAELEGGLSEHELDHVFIGMTDAVPQPDRSEVAACRYASFGDLLRDAQYNPGAYTAWFRILLNDHYARILSGLQCLSREKGTSCR